MATTKITSPDLFNLDSLNTELRLPSGTTAQRPASPSAGEWRFNTSTNLIEMYDGSNWYSIQDEAIPPIPSENFNTVLYTGNGSTQSITGVGFQPDFVWIKKRDATENHRAYDSSRGVGPGNITLYPSLDFAASQESVNGISSLDSDGFTLTSQNAVNSNGNTFVAWCWKAKGGTTSSNTNGTITSTVQANTGAGFSIVEYTGNGSTSATVGHGLSATPELIITKNLEELRDWRVFHTDLSTNQFLTLNTDSAVGTAPGSTCCGAVALVGATTFGFVAGSSSATELDNVNKSGINYVSYCFDSVAGYSKFGSYTGTGSTTNRPIINTGFEPAFVMIKNSTTADDWMIHDNKRNPSNPRDKYIRANTSDQEGEFAEFGLDFLTNGFQVGPTTNNNWNGSGQTYLYIAFAADPSTAPVLADSFNIQTYSGNGGTQALTGFGFTPSMIWFKERANQGYDHGLYDNVRGGTSLIYPDLTNAETITADGIQSFDSDGVTVGSNNKANASGSTYVGWAWKANLIPTINTDGDLQSVVSANQAAGFSIVSFTKTNGNAETIGHGLSEIPELIIMKARGAVGDWQVYAAPIGNTKRLNLNTTSAQSTSGIWNNTTPTDTVFSTTFNPAGSIIAYCFHSVDGFSKIGSYAGNGTSQSVTLGFEPTFLMLRKYDDNQDWFMLDSVRDPSNPKSKRLRANLGSVEVSSSTTISFTSTGFDLPSATFNDSGKNFIYIAFKENPGTPAAIPSGEVAYLVVGAGGGAGGVGGGGGAGGLRTSYGNYTGGGQSAETNITLSAQTYTITIGAGGTASATGGAFNNDGNTGSNGTSSVFGTITSFGGGGGTGSSNTALSGGSGGGCRFGSPGNGTYGQGFDGATGDIGGGGGGAGGAGLSSTAGSCGADGGPGLNVPITGATTYYAGGGAGGVSFASGCSATSGGIGGGGDAGANAGTANTGGGGGGGSWTNNANYTTQGGGNGGSGVVILRMNTSDYSGVTTGSPTVTTVGSETILTYTGSGTYVHS